METEYQYLLHLLGACLREEEPAVQPEADWEKLIRLAQIHNILGLLGYMSMKHPICPDPREKAFLRSCCLDTINTFAQRGALAQLLSAELEAAGIDHILMKGYVLRSFYPVPELRTYGDIDLVIRPEDRKRCHEWMLDHGFTTKVDWDPVYSYVRQNEFYEIHTEIMEIDVSDKADYRGFFWTMWNHAEKTGAHTYQFTPEFHFLYLLTHIAKHIHGSGAGIRMYLDVAAFLRHCDKEMDWNWVQKQLEALKLDTFAAVVLTAVEAWFGVGCSMTYRKADARVLKNFESFTLEAGIFGRHNRDSAAAAMKHEEDDKPSSRMHLLLRRTFPKAETIQSRYTYLQDKPWLLPAAWVHRLVKNKEKLGQRAQEIQAILHTDAEEVHFMHKLMQDIGL